MLLSKRGKNREERGKWRVSKTIQANPAKGEEGRKGKGWRAASGGRHTWLPWRPRKT